MGLVRLRPADGPDQRWPLPRSPGLASRLAPGTVNSLAAHPEATALAAALAGLDKHPWRRDGAVYVGPEPQMRPFEL